MNTTAAFPVLEVSQVAVARRAAQVLADRLGFTAERVGAVALVVSELATNLARHARGGQVLLRGLGPPNGGDGPAGIDVLAIDTGPGMTNLAWSRRDGHSTAGTLGQGLGAVERQAHLFEVYTDPAGTVALARLWRDAPPDRRELSLYDIGSVLVSKAGEAVCGDAVAWRSRTDRLAIFVADGLGHGLAAHDAARAAVRTFEGLAEEPPSRVVADAHAALRATRGAAVACLAIDIARGVASYCGLGNISAANLLASGTRQGMVSQNGTAGHTAARILEFRYPVPRESLIVLHSDGISTHWDISGYPGLRTRHPSIIAGVLYRDFGRGRDDVAVVVVKERRG